MVEVAPLSPDELAPTLGPRPRPLPARAYLDEAVLAFERRQLWARSWVPVAREQELLRPGDYVLAPLTPAGVVVVRGHDLALRAMPNVCQHRAACLLDEPRGRLQRLVCPYHGWTYNLDGSLRSTPPLSAPPADALPSLALPSLRVAEAAGLVFVCADEPWAPFARATEGLAQELGRWPLRRLHLGRRVEHEARANWKLLAENFLESHHFPPVHPELERLTPTARAATLPPRGAWFGGTMELLDHAQTVSLDGTLARRPLLAEPASRVIHDYLMFPAAMLSVQPDYLLTYRLWPRAADRTAIVAEIWFPPSAEAAPGFDPAPVFSFWDRVNAQDRAVCERQQRGLADAGFRGGVYTAVEESCQRFAAMVARCYLGQSPW